MRKGMNPRAAVAPIAVSFADSPRLSMCCGVHLLGEGRERRRDGGTVAPVCEPFGLLVLARPAVPGGVSCRVHTTRLLPV